MKPSQTCCVVSVLTVALLGLPAVGYAGNSEGTMMPSDAMVAYTVLKAKTPQ